MIILFILLDPFIPDEEPELEPEVLIKSEPSITEPTTVVTVHGKKRKRKVIEKTVAGDDGFFCESSLSFVLFSSQN